jgi:hypothetical protein
VNGFGSIHINGGIFNTDSSSFEVDGDANASLSDLAIGMIVTLTVETRNGAFTDKALDVFYDDEVQGPVAATPQVVDGTGGTQKTFKIFGQTVTIDAAETVFEATGFDSLIANDVVEVSGFRISPTEIFASYVEWKGVLMPGSEVELRGTISGYSPPTQQFTLDGVPITFDGATEVELDGGVLGNGLYVEVKGIYAAGPSVHATKIEEEDEGFGDDLDDIELQGPVSNYTSIASFKINGQLVNASQASLVPLNAGALLGNGVVVEVEGSIVAGVLVAEELEVEEIETSLKTYVQEILPGNERFRVNFSGLAGDIEIITNAQTEFEDHGPLGLPNFSVADLIPGDFVSIEGVESSGKVIAGRVDRQDSANPDDSELEGQVDAFVADTSITVLGISFNVDDGTDTEYQDDEVAISAMQFFGRLKNGDRVEITDKVTADGFAEEVSLDD